MFHTHENKNLGLETSSYSNIETGLKPVLLIVKLKIHVHCESSKGNITTISEKQFKEKKTVFRMVSSNKWC